jgi:hypothetical protein
VLGVIDGAVQIDMNNNLFLFLVLGLELRVYALSHSTSPIFVMDFFQDRVL